MPLPQDRSAGELWEIARLVLNARLRLRACDRVGPRTRLWGRPVVRNGGSIVIGDRVMLHSHVVPIELQAVDGASIAIGDGTLVNYGSIISAYESITIGEHCLIAKHVSIMDSNQHDLVHRDRVGPSAPVVIEELAWLGERVIVLPGVRIGAGAVIGAGSIVARDVPPWSLAVGNPARMVRELPERRRAALAR